jgi:PAS domain S-box-containing protein
MKDNSKQKNQLLEELDEMRQRIDELEASEKKYKNMEVELKEVKDSFHRLSDAAFEGIAITKKGILLEINNAFAKMFGYKPSQVIGMNVLKLVAPEYSDLVRQKIQSGYEKPYEAVCINKNGGRFSVEVCGKTINYKGRKARVTAIRDTSIRKKDEESLRQSRGRFRALVETTSDWIWEVDENAVYNYVSSKIRDILGYEPEEVLGKTPFNLMPPDEAKRVADIFGPIASSQKPFKELENTNLHKDGHLVVLETSGVPIFNRDGKFCGYRGIDRDITDRKQAVNKLRMRARELKESNIALKVLLKQRENDKGEFEENILSNIKHLIIPYIEKLKKNRAMSEELTYLNIVESNLNEIISPFALKLSSSYLGLTPKEIQIADLTRDGKQDKEISELLNISIDTVKFHKKNIRKKVGIYGTRTNLRTHLLSMIKQ